MKTRFLPLALILTCSLNAFAQMPSSPGIGAAITKLFEVDAFSAKAQVRVLDASKAEVFSGPMDFSLLNGKIRAELDMAQMQNKAMPAEAIASLKQLGMTKVVSTTRPDKKLIYVIYPDKKSYTSMPMSDEDAAMAEKKTKLQKTSLGKETIDGHPCVKNKTVVIDDRGTNVLEAITWNATDLKDFPVQLETKEQGNTSVVTFKQVQLSAPDAKRFDPPTDYKEYRDAMELMQALIKEGPAAAQPK